MGYSYLEEQRKKQEEEDTQNIIEYGTRDPKKIAEIKAKRKAEKKSNTSFWIFIVTIGIAIYMLMGGIAKCAGSKFDPFEDNDTEWQYRHTDRVK